MRVYAEFTRLAVCASSTMRKLKFAAPVASSRLRNELAPDGGGDGPAAWRSIVLLRCHAPEFAGFVSSERPGDSKGRVVTTWGNR